MVLLSSLSSIYQGARYEVDSHYGGRETSEGSLVSCRSKDGMAGDEPLPSISANQLCYLRFNKLIKYKEKCSSVVDDRSLHSYEMFVAMKGPKPDMIFVKVLYSRKEELARQSRRVMSKERVIHNLRIG